MKDGYIVGLDVGSRMIHVIVAGPSEGEGGGVLTIKSAIMVPSEGIARDSVASMDEAARSIVTALERAERALGVPIETAWVGVSGSYINTRPSKGHISVSKANGEISQQDIERAIDTARTAAMLPNHEILHVIPRMCMIDGQGGIKDPIGMSGLNLEVDTRIVHGLSTHVKNFTKTIYKTGLDIDDIVFSPLALGDVLLSGRQKDLGVAIVNIGAATTSVAVFEGGEIYHASVLPLGSDHITSDIAIGLRVSLDAAEKIKMEYGSISERDGAKRGDIQLESIDPHERGTVSGRYIAEIIEARVEEIFEKVEDEIRLIGMRGTLPAGIILTGGGSHLPGIVDIAKKKLKLPASFARVRDVFTYHDSLLDPSFSTALGLAYWGWMQGEKHSKSKRTFFGTAPSGDAQDRVKKWFRSLLP